MKSIKSLISFVKKYRNRIAFIHDVFAVVISLYLACWLLFPVHVEPHHNPYSLYEQYWHQTRMILPGVLLAQVLLFYGYGLYRGFWRFASLQDLKKILMVSFLGSLFVLSVAIYGKILPESTALVYGIILAGMLSFSRLAFREMGHYRKIWTGSQRVIIAGAGNAGEGLVRDMLRDRGRRYRPVAFVDDDAEKQGREIHGIRVAGMIDRLPDLVQKMRTDLVLVAIPSASSANMRTITDICEQTGIPFYTLPGIVDLADGRVSINVLRNIMIEDLLGRFPVSCQWNEARSRLEGRRILVTGGGGSIGSELCRQIAGIESVQLVVLDNSEYNLYTIDLDLQKNFPHCKFESVLLSVTDSVGIRNVFDRFRPHLVFHAAACKHVPLLESQVRMALMTNITGTRIVAENAAFFGAEAFVLISSDKAVNPANIMGASKRAAEYFCQNFSDRLTSKTRFVTVRFGNVLGSAGSVVPLFRQQIEAGGPVTVTHPDIMRFFMTIPEASQLILQAAFLGAGGEIYILDMGDPIRISYLAEQMIRLAGKIPHRDIKIVYTGLRPGEKLYEEYFYPEEILLPTENPKILCAQPQKRDFMEIFNLINGMERLCDEIPERTDELVTQLIKLVPEYAKTTRRERADPGISLYSVELQ